MSRGDKPDRSAKRDFYILSETWGLQDFVNLVGILKFDSGGCWSSVDCQMMAIHIIKTRGQFPSTSSAVLSLHS